MVLSERSIGGLAPVSSRLLAMGGQATCKVPGRIGSPRDRGTWLSAEGDGRTVSCAPCVAEAWLPQKQNRS